LYKYKNIKNRANNLFDVLLVKSTARKTKLFRQLNAFASHLRYAPDTGSAPEKVTSRLDQMIIKTDIISVFMAYRNT